MHRVLEKTSACFIDYPTNRGWRESLVHDIPARINLGIANISPSRKAIQAKGE